MNETLIKIAEQYERTAEILLQKAKDLRNGINPNKCIHGKYTNKPFKGCKTCGAPKVVICSSPKVIGKKRNSKLCNPAGCKYFESLKLNT